MRHNALIFLPAWERLSLQNILASYSYVTKAKQIIDLKPDRIILGSSVENYGMRIKGSFLNYIDPAPEKADKLRSIFPRNIELYDAAIGGGGLDEAYQYLQHAYLNNPDLNEVVLGLEWREFAASLPNQETKNLPTVSALARTSTPVDFLLQYTISKLALDYALELFGARGQQYNAASMVNLLPVNDPVAINAVSTSKITDVNMWLVPYEPEYRGYKIYSLLGSFVAIPASVKPPFDLLTLLKINYPGMLKAGGLKEIQAAINRKKEGGL